MPSRDPAPILPEPLESRRLFAAGDLDPTFGTGGRVVAPTVPGEMIKLAPLGGEKFLGLSRTSGETSAGAVLRRFNADGTPDTTFATNGTADVFSGGGQRPVDLLVRGDGKI